MLTETNHHTITFLKQTNKKKNSKTRNETIFKSCILILPRVILSQFYAITYGRWYILNRTIIQIAFNIPRWSVIFFLLFFLNTAVKQI